MYTYNFRNQVGMQNNINSLSLWVYFCMVTSESNNATYALFAKNNNQNSRYGHLTSMNAAFRGQQH